MPERDRAPAPALDQRLRVRPVRRAGGRVARVADRGVAVQAAQLLLVEDLRDEAHVAQHRQPAVVGDGDPGRLLAAVLQREEAEEGHARDVALGRADAEDAAHQATVPSSRRWGQSGRSPARITEPYGASPVRLEVVAAEGRGLGERVREAAVADVVRERELRRVAPEPADQLDLVALGQPDRVARPPAARHLAHVRHEPDAPDDGRRRNRPPVGLVVERHVARDDRNPERLRRLGDPLDRLGQLPADLGLLRVAEVEAVGQRERLAAGAGDVARRAEHRRAPGLARVAAAERRPVERDREPAPRRPQLQHRRVEPRPAHGAREDELVVLPVDPLLRLEVDRVDLGARPRGCEAVDLVARALVRQERRRDLADDLVVPEGAQLAGLGHLADRRVVELPAREHGLDLREPLGPDDGDHPLLALGDHDLPGLHAVLAQRDAVEVDVDAHVAGHLGERGGEPGRAAVLQRLDEPGLDELERGLDQLLAREGVADLDASGACPRRPRRAPGLRAPRRRRSRRGRWWRRRGRAGCRRRARPRE